MLGYYNASYSDKSTVWVSLFELVIIVDVPHGNALLFAVT